MTEQELEEYFKKDKSHWIILDSNRKKNWNEEEVAVFWNRIREYKMAKGDFNFNNYVFPKLERNVYYSRNNISNTTCNFWKQGEKRVFNKRVDFNFATFLDEAFFNRVEFLNDASFTGCSFYKKAVFIYSKFHGITDFTRIKYGGEVDFSNALFSKEVHFSNGKFSDNLWFIDTHFYGLVQLSNVIFNRGLEFYNCYFQDLMLMNFCQFESLIIKRIDCKLDYTKLAPNFVFKDIKFSKNDLFSNLDMANVAFINSDLGELTLSRCHWNLSQDRLILKYESNIKFHTDVAETLKDNTLYNLTKYNLNQELDSTGVLRARDSEEHYRQLKKNFEGGKNWELSGFAYVSEMEMRKRRLWDEKRYFDWFVYWFYGFFGGYTQNYQKPIFSLAILIVISSLVYFFIDYNYVNAFQRGINGALPYIKINIDEPFKDNWLIIRNIEFILSGTFLTFFILALRKRFKQ